MVDLEHWLLLASIVDRVHSNEESRRIKTWLVPLLNRTPFAPVVVAYLRLVPSLTSERREALVIPFLRCFGFIWPLTTQKVNAEVLLECFGTYLDTILSVSEHASDRFLTELGPLITTSYRNSLSNSTSKKKVQFNKPISSQSEFTESIVIRLLHSCTSWKLAAMHFA